MYRLLVYALYKKDRIPKRAGEVQRIKRLYAYGKRMRGW